MIVAGIRAEWIVYGVGVGLALLVLNQLMGGRIVTAAAETVARAPSDAVIGAAAGLFGLPDTRTPESVSKCQAALSAGNDWDASFYCPAGDWLRGVIDGR